MSTVLSELVSRGLLWARVLTLSFIMPIDAYGSLIVLISAEALAASVVSYPVIKDVLMRQEISRRSFLHMSILFLCLLPALPLLMLTGYFDFGLLVVVAVSTYFSASSQVSLYILRVVDIRHHNRYKLAAAIMSTFLFVLLLPISPRFLPLIAASSAATVLFGLFRCGALARHQFVSILRPSYVLSGWLIFGTQAIINNFSQYGVRLLIAAYFGATQVAIFTKSYMIATGVFFIFSAIMIQNEPVLSRVGSLGEVKGRTGNALIVFAALIGTLLVYVAFVGLAWQFRYEFPFNQLFQATTIQLFAVFFVFIGFNAAYFVLNPLVLALGGRLISLAASTAGFALQFGLLVSFSNDMNIVRVGGILAVGQAFAAALLFLYLFWRMRFQND